MDAAPRAEGGQAPPDGEATAPPAGVAPFAFDARAYWLPIVLPLVVVPVMVGVLAVGGKALPGWIEAVAMGTGIFVGYGAIFYAIPVLPWLVWVTRRAPRWGEREHVRALGIGPLGVVVVINAIADVLYAAMGNAIELGAALMLFGISLAYAYGYAAVVIVVGRVMGLRRERMRRAG